MTSFTRLVSACAVALSAALLTAAVVLVPSSAAVADDEQVSKPSGGMSEGEATPAAEKGGEAGQGDAEDEGEEKKESEGSNVTFFPGVKGISGKELERIIREREKRREEEERKARRHADNREGSTERSAEESPAARPAGRPKPAETPVEVSATGLKTTGLSDEAREYLKTLALRTERLEYLLEKVDEIRVEAEADAAKVGNVALIHYILQYTNRSTKATRAYESHIQLPLTLYRCVFDQAVATLRFAQARPDDMSGDAAKIADDYTARLKDIWRRCLLATAELYTDVRQLKTAEIIYATLTKEFPKDSEVKKSYEGFVKVRDTPKPDVPPGTQTGGGGAGRIYDNGRGEDGDDDEPMTPEDRIKRRYTR